jgi:hypothetical protein
MNLPGKQPSNEAMERSGAHDGKRRCGGRFRAAEKEVMLVYGQMFARRSSPGRYADHNPR